MKNEQKLQNSLIRLPVIAILRGVSTEDAVAVAEVLVAAGIGAIEIPLNSKDALVSIAKLKHDLPRHVAVGAGTVLSAKDVDQLAACGADFSVSPNTNRRVIKRALAHDIVPIPGFYSPSEAFCAVAAGAQYLKLFPANTVHAGFMPALKSVLPASCKVFAVGGVSIDTAASFLQQGFYGVGIGGSLYCGDLSLSDIEKRARAFARVFAS